MRRSGLMIVYVGVALWRMGALGAGGLAGGSIEDLRANKLLDKGRLRYDVGEYPEALEIYKNVIDRFPKSRRRWTALLLIGKHWFSKKDYEKAVGHLHRCSEGSESFDEVAEAVFLIGVSHYEQKDYAKCFSVLRRVTANYPGTEFCNRAYYHIGMGHFNLRHYTRAIEAFRMVGTSIREGDPNVLRLAPGKRLFIKVNDADLKVASRQKKTIRVVVAAKSGDTETVDLESRGITGVEFIGSVKTELGEPDANNGILEVVGTDTATITYVDQHAGDKQRDVPRVHAVTMADDANLAFVNGIFKSRVEGIALDRTANVRLLDADLDLNGERQRVEVVIRSKRAAEVDLAARATGAPEERQYEIRDEEKLVLREVEPSEGEKTCHSHQFTGRVVVREGKPQKGDQVIQAAKGDVIEVEYVDRRRLREDTAITLSAEATIVKGDLTEPVPYDGRIRSASLRVKAELQMASALMHMGRIYKELGLRTRAEEKFDEAVKACARVRRQADGNWELLERGQCLLWEIYFQKGDLDKAAAVCMDLITKFPNSDFADDALLMMGRMAQKQADEGQDGGRGYARAIGFYKRLLAVVVERDAEGQVVREQSPLAPDAQYCVGECYEAMGKENPANCERALEAYQQCAEDFPLSKFAPKSITKIANFYYQMKQYDRALAIYQKTMRDYPDAEFLDLVILNCGKCLVMMREYAEAADMFAQVIEQHPTSSHVKKAEKYWRYVIEKLRKLGKKPRASNA